jgi:cell division transport system permease protein
MIAISLLVVGAFLLLAENLSGAAAEWQGRSRVTIYLTTDATSGQTEAVRRFLATQPELRRHAFVTREEALRRFRTWFTSLAEVIGELDENPFPASFEVEVSPREAQSARLHQQIAALRSMPGVDQVQYDWQWIERLRKLIGIINVAGLAAGGVLGMAAAFTIANVIRLTMMLYREEIEIMRLVGATERLIRAPFLVEGFLQGTFGALVAIGTLYAAWEMARRSLAPSSSLLFGFLFAGFLPWQKLAALLAGGMLAGWFGSWLSVRRTD